MNVTNSIIINPKLGDFFWTSWKKYQIIMFSAPCGFGKTTLAKGLLSKRKVFELNPLNLPISTTDIPIDCNVVLVDDLQYLIEVDKQKELCNLIRSRIDLHFVLLSRGNVPGWLMPFQFTGSMVVIEEPKLRLDSRTSQRILESHGIDIDSEEINKIHRDTEGYPLALNIIANKLKGGKDYNNQILSEGRYDLFFYFEEFVYIILEAPIRLLLLSIAPFESFSLELARIVSGDPRAGEHLGTIYRNTSMLYLDKMGDYHCWPFFREFLMWELQKKFTDVEKRMIYSKAALYYELNEEFGKALDFYTLSKEDNKVSALLVKNSEQNPGVGYYLEMKDYYLALPREEILKSPSLITAMSMLAALCMDYQASENWYEDLENYLTKLKKNDYEYKIVRGKLGYLDISLPQRGSKELIKIIASVFRLITDKEIKLPSFSVTSTLPSIMNGGKDFCRWSKKDDILYSTMKKPVEVLLGKDGVGLADYSICESKFEKGQDISKELLTLMSRLGDIQVSGTSDIEFAVIGLLCRVQISQGNPRAALETIQSLRNKFYDAGETRFLSNIDAVICRINIQLRDIEAVRIWFKEKAPKNDIQLWMLWRYQYITRIMVQIVEGEYEDALILLARFSPYCHECDRVMDSIYVLLLKSICKGGLEDESWQDDLNKALDICYDYKFISPVTQYGVAILPLLLKSNWSGDEEYFEGLLAATRVQAAQYPKFLKAQIQLIETLSLSENEVLKLLCKNLSNKEIGKILGIKISTVKSHVSSIFRKLGVKRRSQAKAIAEKLNLV